MNPSTSDDKSKAFLEEPLPKDPQENDNNLSEGSQSSDDDEDIKADLLQHPLFQHEKDDTLSWLIRVLKPLLEPNPNFEGLQGKIERFSSLLFRAIFENKKISDLKKLFGQFDTLTKTVCGEQIVSGTFYFRCLDCERGDNPEMVSAVCPDCFDRANHDGHRVIFVDVSDDEEEDEGFCDCGDPEMLNPAGFCSFHRSVELNPNEVLQNFPQAQVKKCQSVLGKAIYGVISVFEIAKKISNKDTYENIQIVAWGFLDQVFQCLENGYKNISGSFIFIIASILQAQFPAPFNKFWHDCDNFTTFETQLNGLSECKCTVLGNLLRFSSLYPDDSQLSLQSLLMACMKVSKFKDFAAVEYIKYCKVMFPQAFGKKSKTFPETSKLTSVNRAFISPETTTLKMAESGYIIHYPQIIKGLVSKYNNMNSKIQKTLQSLEGIISAIVNPKYRSSTGRIIEKTSFMRDLLEAMTIFQKKFLYKGELSLGMDITKVKFDLINEIADSEKNITSGFENGLRYISQCPHEEKVKYIKEIIPEWIEHYNYLKEYRSTEAKKDHIEISLALERTFCYIIQAYNKVISKENLEEFFKTFLPEVKIDVFAREILERVVKQLGLMRCLVQNDITAEEKLINGYYYPINLLFEIDVVLIQMMTLLVNPDDLFQSLTNNYFSRNKSLRNFCKGEQFTGKEGEKEKELNLLKDFLHFLTFFMNDELCLLEIFERHISIEEMKQNPQQERILTKVVINALLSQEIANATYVKDALYNILVNSDSIDEIISKVAIFDKKDLSIKIANHFLSEYDPYLFFKLVDWQEFLFKQVSEREAFKSSDLVSGKFYNDLPSYLKNIQHQIFLSALPNFLSSFIERLTQETSSILKPVLKLILFNLQVTNEALKNNVNEGKELLKKVEENYFKESFGLKISEILKQGEFKDCYPCIAKIWKNLTDFSAYSQQKLMEIDIPKETNENLKDEKKENIAEIKAEESKEAENAEKTDLTCSHCSETISKASDRYGVPVYVTFTNNFHNSTKPIERSNFFSFLESECWPVVSSCNHHYHQECYEIILKNTQAQYKDSLKASLSNGFEACCSVCQGLNNNFILLGYGSSGENENDQESYMKKENKRFVHKIETIFYTLLDRMTQYDFKMPEIDLGKLNFLELFIHNGYEYFLEGFYLTQKPQQLMKSFEVYTNLFKTLKSSFVEKEQSKLISSLSFFELLWETKSKELNSLENKEKVKALLEYQPELLLSKLFASILTNGFLSQNQSKQEDILKKVHINIFKEYLQYKIVQIISLEKLNTSVTLKECIDSFQSDESLRNRILEALVFPIKKIVFAFCLNKSTLLDTETLGNNIATLLFKQDLSIKELDCLLNQAGIDDDMDKILKEVIQELNVKFGQGLEILNTMLLPKDASISIEKHKIPIMRPQILALPQVYLDYCTMYFKKKCSLCKLQTKYVKICLICGEVICIGECTERNSSGNLNYHALKYHMGVGLFMDRMDFTLDVTNSPFQILGVKRDVYVDDLGQPVDEFLAVPESNLSAFDFKKFTISPLFKEEIDSIIEQQSIARFYFDIRIKMEKEDEENCQDDGLL